MGKKGTITIYLVSSLIISSLSVFPAPFGRDLTKEEAYIQRLDGSTGSSLKLTVLNAEGRVWTMVAGGGASVVYSFVLLTLINSFVHISDNLLLVKETRLPLTALLTSSQTTENTLAHLLRTRHTNTPRRSVSCRFLDLLAFFQHVLTGFN
jgi:hypothetical protein